MDLGDGGEEEVGEYSLVRCRGHAGEFFKLVGPNRGICLCGAGKSLRLVSGK